MALKTRNNRRYVFSDNAVISIFLIVTVSATIDLAWRKAGSNDPQRSFGGGEQAQHEVTVEKKARW